MASSAGVVKQEAVGGHCSRSPPNAAAEVVTIQSSGICGGGENEPSDVEISFNSPGKRGTPSTLTWACPISGAKKPKVEEINHVLAPVPLSFLDPLSSPAIGGGHGIAPADDRCKQFWKAGDYAATQAPNSRLPTIGGIDHVRVHPRFLHSNATSHKWALGAFAELLDNALDEVRTGASYVKVDMLVNNKDNNSKMLLVEDNGGGMRPDKMRQCMSLGYSAKSTLADTIGQYGNGFKTSTMRLGADVIVFSCCSGDNDGSCPTMSVGLLSYTFLRSTGMEDIVVPMIDYEKGEQGEWRRIIRSSDEDWGRNLDTITTWSPYSTQEELLLQLQSIGKQGTRIVIYNLWEDDEGQLELDFDADLHDIQIRGVNRDNNNIRLAQQFPNATHFLTYRHSLRSYAAILYLRIPPGFRIVLRGRDVAHHSLVNDMIHRMQHTYRPQLIADATLAASIDMVAVVTLGFVKDAEAHINIQGFSVYHKNRLIKPFWRVWNAAGSDGRGVIGVLEANFIEPAHDKQGFERTISLSRLETRLIKLQKDYWRDNCQKVGYAPRRQPRNIEALVTRELAPPNRSRRASSDGNGNKFTPRGRSQDYSEETSASGEDYSNGPESDPTNKKQESNTTSAATAAATVDSSLSRERRENAELKKRLLDVEDSKTRELEQLLQLERDHCKSLEARLVQAEKKIKEMDKEQEALVEIFSEERNQRDIEEEKLRQRLKLATTTIQELGDRLKLLERRTLSASKTTDK